MLYQTHHSFFFQFPSFASIPLPPLILSRLSSSVQEMVRFEAALKSSWRTEMPPKASPQAISDDFWAVYGQNGISSDDFLVEDFLDLSNEEGLFEQEPEEEEEDKVPTSSLSFSPKKQDPEDHSSNEGTSLEFGSLPTSELSVPADFVADLEWLSHFVEDSNSEYSAAFPAGIIPQKPNSSHDSQREHENPATSFKTPVPAKARSKRKRTGGWVGSLVMSSPVTESSSSSSSSSASCSPSSTCLIPTKSIPGSGSPFEPVEPFFSEKPPAVKKQKKKHVTDSAGGNATQPPRRCSHCGVTKTPQWRAGPLGAKTLCNACGVRFKSGRLLPEYRPACSPTFSTELHSNHHRKVLEMRRKKEMVMPEPTLPPPAVPSFG
ncbi:hypothetical protein SLA2020_184980 [Shorea laevis]